MINATKTLFYALQVKGIADFVNPDVAATSFAMTVHAILDHEFDLMFASTSNEVGSEKKIVSGNSTGKSADGNPAGMPTVGKMMQDYFEASDELLHVFCLVDIRHDPTADDIQMNTFLRQMGIPFTVIATKCDKISRGARQKQLAPICRALLVQPWQIICFSSEDGTGRDQILEEIDKVLTPEEEPEDIQDASDLSDEPETVQ